MEKENEDRRAQLLKDWPAGVWDTEELRAQFEVIGFCAPAVAVRRKSDGAKGTLFFDHMPRFYYGFAEDPK